MKLAITVMNLIDDLILYDTETKEDFRIKTALPQAQYRPYGLTWNEDTIFIANKTNLSIYNSNLELVETRKGILDFNTHQILVRGDELIVCMTTRDHLKFINLKNNSERYWSPAFGWMDKPFPMKEKYHINTVLSYENRIYAMLHWFSRKNTQIAEVDGEILTLDARSGHNIYRDGNTLGFIDTKRRRLIIGDHSVTCDMWKERRMFLRGLAGDDKELSVGCSNRNPVRELRRRGDSVVTVVKEGEVYEHHTLIGSGDIDDVRRIDGPDFCHHNPHPFPYTKF